MAVLRWRFDDPADPSSAGAYTFPWNPRAMSSPFPEKAITTQGTVAVGGLVVLWEGAQMPQQWTFTGTTKNAAHYEALRSWVLDRPSGRIYVWDHFGRRLTVVLKAFKAEPPNGKAKVGRYWSHEYTITALVLAVSAPTVGDGGPA